MNRLSELLVSSENRKTKPSSLRKDSLEENEGLVIQLKKCDELQVDLEATRKNENQFDVDAGEHEKAFMHVGDTGVIESEEEEAGGCPLCNRNLKIKNESRSLEIRFDNNGVGTEIESLMVFGR